MSKPPRRTAPPIPTTTPMTVFFVFVVMPDDVPSVSLSEAAFVDLLELEDVVDEVSLLVV